MDTTDPLPAPESDMSQQVDFFAFGDSVRHEIELPDGTKDGSWVTISVMNEGQRRKFQSKTNRKVDIDRNTENMSLLLTPVEDNHALIETALDGWNFKRNGDDVPFNTRNVQLFLEHADPRIVDQIGQAIRDANPWMLTEAMTVEAIDEEIEQLEKRRKLILDKELGKAD